MKHGHIVMSAAWTYSRAVAHPPIAGIGGRRPRHCPGYAGRSDHRRELLSDIYEAAIDAVRGEHLIRTHSRLDRDAWVYEQGGRRKAWPLDPKGRVFAIGAGKAAGGILAGLEAVLGERLAGGCAIVKHGHAVPLAKIALFEAGHPTPDEAGVRATLQMLEFLKVLGPHDALFVALTGGASALMVAPAEGLTLAEKARATDLLIASGATISEINLVRKHLSKVKGGRLRKLIHPARSMTLLISDVPGNDLATIGSGPTFPDCSTSQQAMAVLERHGLLGRVPPAVLAVLREPPARSADIPRSRHAHILLADSGAALAAAEAAAARRGYPVHIVDAHLAGDTHAAARHFAAAMRAVARPCVLLAAGETTLKVTGEGKGGRNQEFAMVAARELDGVANATLLASGTDGTDGPTDAAGAFVDGETLARARAAGLDLGAMLADNDSNRFFATLGDLHVTGPTGTNVMDLVVGIVA